MAAAISAINAKLRSHPVLNYVCSTRTSDLFLPSMYMAFEGTDALMRFLGPGLQLRYPSRSSYGYSEGP